MNRHYGSGLKEARIRSRSGDPIIPRRRAGQSPTTSRAARGERLVLLFCAVGVEVALALVAVHLVEELLEQLKPGSSIRRILVEIVHLMRVHIVVVEFPAEFVRVVDQAEAARACRGCARPARRCCCPPVDACARIYKSGGHRNPPVPHCRHDPLPSELVV